MDDNNRDHLLNRQYSNYSRVHGNRVNLVLHLATVPLFMAGTVAVASAWLWPWLLAIGPAAMMVAMGLQGRGHREEKAPPEPFAGLRDVVARIFAEQWITFPRFVASGGFARAWRGGR
jgi:Protein of unknown function (DUF962)